MSNVIEFELGKWSKRKIAVPNPTTVMEAESGKSIFMFGKTYEKVLKNNKQKVQYRKMYGIGKVYRIIHTENFDVIYMQFGFDNDVNSVIVYENRARRQVMTLKRGSFCDIIGFGAYGKWKTKYGKEIKCWRWYAEGLRSWYVPTMFDIKKDNEEIQFDEPTDKENEMFDGDDILESFRGLKNGTL